MKRPYGMTPAMFDAYIRATFAAGVNPETTSDDTKRVVQTIGSAKLSAGFHAADGTVTAGGAVIPYCAAVDLSVRGLTSAQIKKLLQELSRQGFAAWYRFEGSFANIHHIHAVYAGVKMKPQLIAQVMDFLNDRNGLVGHATEKFYTAPRALDAPLAAMLARSNPSVAPRIAKLVKAGVIDSLA